MPVKPSIQLYKERSLGTILREGFAILFRDAKVLWQAALILSISFPILIIALLFLRATPSLTFLIMLAWLIVPIGMFLSSGLIWRMGFQYMIGLEKNDAPQNSMDLVRASLNGEGIYLMEYIFSCMVVLLSFLFLVVPSAFVLARNFHLPFARERMKSFPNQSLIQAKQQDNFFIFLIAFLMPWLISILGRIVFAAVGMEMMEDLLKFGIIETPDSWWWVLLGAGIIAYTFWLFSFLYSSICIALHYYSALEQAGYGAMRKIDEIGERKTQDE